MVSSVVSALFEEYLEHPFTWSLGVIVLGWVTHRVLSSLILWGEEPMTYQNSEDSLLSDMILPSRCLRRSMVRFRRSRHSAISSVKNLPTSSNWRPVLVFANRKSGSNQGAEILDQCRKLLNPCQVHDLSDGQPSKTLEICQLLPDTEVVVLVCGGDGSVNWVLSEIDQLDLADDPVVAVLPLGTGNDLSIMLGWGSSFGDSDSVENFLAELRYGSPVKVDRWTVKIECPRSYLSWKSNQRNFSMTNYFSIGCDALIALRFHRQRQKKPNFFTSRSLNRLFYVGYGAIDVLEQHCKDLDSNIELFLDGQKVDLPSLEGLLFLNISSWGGGCKIWDNKLSDDTYSPSDPGDGIIEVMGISSSFHMAQMQVNLSEPIRLGQASRASVFVKTKVPMQSDGEPWEQEPCRVDISFHKNVTLLMKNLDVSCDDTGGILQLETN